MYAQASANFPGPLHAMRIWTCRLRREQKEFKSASHDRNTGGNLCCGSQHKIRKHQSRYKFDANRAINRSEQSASTFTTDDDCFEMEAAQFHNARNCVYLLFREISGIRRVFINLHEGASFLLQGGERERAQARSDRHLICGRPVRRICRFLRNRMVQHDVGSGIG
jgi:hypothetical protein